MADVFLSYSRANLGAAKRVAAHLRSGGFSVWFDENLPAHRAYSDVIEEQLDAAAAVVVLWSKDAVASQWVRSEANRARETARLVQLRLDAARLPMPFDQIQCADLRKWSGDENSPAWKIVVASICALVGRATGEEPHQADDRTGIDRRTLLIAGGAAAAVAAAGFVGWQSFGTHKPSPQAQLLLQKGLDALQSNDALETESPGSTKQAIAFLTDATDADPRSATAWGALAMAYAVRKRASPLVERGGLDARSRSAAATALQIDPKEPRALAALLLLDPLYRNWASAERAARDALRIHPQQPILFFILSDMLGSVGRWKEAADLSNRLDRTKFLIPGADRKVILNNWAAGNLQRADEAVEQAVEHWPQHPQIWRLRLFYLMFSGRPSEALALAANEAERPPGTSPQLIATVEATGAALAGQRDPREAVRLNLEYAKAQPSSVLQVAQACAALGDKVTALALLQGYYFSDNEWAALAPPAGDQDRSTVALFQPPMRGLWKDPRFNALIEKIGLETYWRRTGTVPDFRR